MADRGLISAFQINSINFSDIMSKKPIVYSQLHYFLKIYVF